jgi:hypothetical protein
VERTRQDVMAWFRRDMERLVESVSGLSEDEWHTHVSGEWTLKDVVAHVAAWDDELRRAIDDVLRNEMPRLAETDEDELNAEFVARRRDRPVAAVLDELRRAHESLLARVMEVDDREWRRKTDMRWPDGPPLTVSSLFDYDHRGQSHYAGHAEEIERWRVLGARPGNDPSSP